MRVADLILLGSTSSSVSRKSKHIFLLSPLPCCEPLLSLKFIIIIIILALRHAPVFACEEVCARYVYAGHLFFLSALFHFYILIL